MPATFDTPGPFQTTLVAGGAGGVTLRLAAEDAEQVLSFMVELLELVIEIEPAVDDPPQPMQEVLQLVSVILSVTDVTAPTSPPIQS